MRVVLALWALLATQLSTASAQGLEDDILQCWNPPPAYNGEVFMATFDVVFDAKGYVQDATVLTFEPDNKIGRDNVSYFVRAMKRCEPFDGLKAGTLRVTLDTSPTNKIDPFKGK